MLPSATQQSPFARSFFQNAEIVTEQPFLAAQQPQFSRSIQQAPSFSYSAAPQSPMVKDEQPAVKASIYDVFQTPEVKVQQTPSKLPQVPVQAPDNLDRVVTVFGFPPEASSTILAMFRPFGNIVSYEYVGNSNWMLIEYEKETQARMALRQNGSLVDGNTMVGVISASRIGVKLDAPESTGKTPLSAALSPMRFPTSSGKQSASKRRHQRGFNSFSSPADSSFSQSVFPTPVKQSQQPVDVKMKYEGSPMMVEDMSFDYTRKPSMADIFDSSRQHHTPQPQKQSLYPKLDETYSQPNIRQPKPLPRDEEEHEMPKTASIMGKLAEVIFNWG